MWENLEAAGTVGDGGQLRELLAVLTRPFQPVARHQVRIEQHFSIRITPGGPMMPPNVLVELQQPDAPPRYQEHKMGKCIAWGAIEAVQGGEGNRLLLFLRDQRIVSAELEKVCQARDFYSGFLFTRTADGQICVNRDMLQSRSGANCRIRRLRALIEAPDRRFP